MVRSALAQQGCDLEVVVTDDTRGPDVEAALAPFRADPRFRYLRNETQLGAVRNWNHALEMAEGRVRKLLHHDDWFVDETSLIQLVAPILEGRARVAFTACNALNAKEEFEYFHGAAPEKIAALRAHHNAILFENFIGPPSVCATDASLPTRFDPRFMWTSDMDFYNRAVRDAGGSIAYNTTPLLNISTDFPFQISRRFERTPILGYVEFADMFEAADLDADETARARAYLDQASRQVPWRDLARASCRALARGRPRLASWILHDAWRAARR